MRELLASPFILKTGNLSVYCPINARHGVAAEGHVPVDIKTPLKQAQTMRITLCLSALILTHFAQAQVPSNVPTDGLVAWYPFNGNAMDETGNGGNGTVYGATLVADRFGNPNAAYHFNGTSNYIKTAPVSVMEFGANESFTINLWIRSDDAVQFANLYDRYACEQTTGNTATYASDHVNIDYQTDSIVLGNRRGQQLPDLGVFTTAGPSSLGQLMITYIKSSADTSIALYLDGEFVSKTYLTYLNGQNNGNNAPGVPITFGAGRNCSLQLPGAFFNGDMDDIGIWDRALTQQELTELFAGPTATPCLSSTPVSFTGLDASYTTTDGIVALVGVPAGGVFIGPGVSGSAFDPEMAGVGTHSVTYTYVDADGCINTAGLCTTVDLGTGIVGNGMAGSGNVRVYPNPNAGQFTLETELMGLVSLQVFDVKGQLVHNEVFQGNGTRNTRMIDLSRFARGSYSMRVQNAGSTVVQTVIVE